MLVSAMVMFSHGATALHWNVATFSVFEEPVRLRKVKFFNWNCEFVQFPTALLNVVHCEIARGASRPFWKRRSSKRRSEATIRLATSSKRQQGSQKKLTSKPASATVGWIAHLITGPRLEVHGSKRIIVGDVTRMDALDCLKSPFILADASYSDTIAVEKHAVLDCNIARVGFGADTVITIIDDPVAEGNV